MIIAPSLQREASAKAYRIRISFRATEFRAISYFLFPISYLRADYY
jgi:hypothetical protein